MAAVTATVTEEGLSFLGWREVPTDGSMLGDLARLSAELLADPGRVSALVSDVRAPLEASVGVVELDADGAALLARARDICLDRLLEGGDR